MRISIGFSGAAGTGVNTSGLLLGQVLAQKGYSIFADKEYASIIKGDNNNFFLYISDKKNDMFLSQNIDYFFAFDDYSVSKNEKIYTLKNVFNVKEQASKRKNVFCFGASLKVLSLSLEEGIAALKTQFSAESLDENVTELTNGYNYMTIVSDFNASATIDTPKSLMFGNECIAK
jgi:Pyruvate/2-oxoacid:ferredoxin oxidoreductase gamma subunit